MVRRFVWTQLVEKEKFDFDFSREQRDFNSRSVIYAPSVRPVTPR